MVKSVMEKNHEGDSKATETGFLKGISYSTILSDHTRLSVKGHLQRVAE